MARQRSSERGITIFFTGLSGAGKSTLAKGLAEKFEAAGRAVTLLDGDVVRRELSSELGFSRQDRGTNVRRIGFVAREVTRHGGLAICAPIAPYDAARREVRRMVENVRTKGCQVPQEICKNGLQGGRQRCCPESGRYRVLARRLTKSLGA